MIGKTWREKETDEVYHFLSFKQKGDIVHIATDKEWLETTYYDLIEYVTKFEEVEIQNNTLTVIKTPDEKYLEKQKITSEALPKDTMIQLRDILLGNIQKTNDDASFVPQAKQISNTVNSLINLAKMELLIKTKENQSV